MLGVCRFGVWTNKIQYTKPPEHLCLLNKLLQSVLVRVLTWSCHMIGVPSFDLPNTFAWWLHHVCLPLIHARIHANQKWANQKWAKGGSYSRRPLPYLPSPSPFFPSSLSPLDACYAGYDYYFTVNLMQGVFIHRFFHIDFTKTYNLNAPPLVTPTSHKIMAKMRYSTSKDTAFNRETMFAPWRSQNPLRLTQWVNQSLQSSYTAKWRTSGQSLWITATGHIARD